MLLTNRGWRGGRSCKDKRAEICYGGNTARGLWDIVGDRSNKGALEVEIVEDVVVYASESLEFELDVLCMEPLEESDFIVMQERPLKNVGDPLALLCMHWRVIDVAGNGGLSVR